MSNRKSKIIDCEDSNMDMTEVSKRIDDLVKGKMEGKWANLSRASGVSQQTLNKIKQGTEPRIGNLKKIAEALNVTTDWLINGREPPKENALEKIIKLLNKLSENQLNEIVGIIEERVRWNEVNNLVAEIQKKLK